MEKVRITNHADEKLVGRLGEVISRNGTELSIRLAGGNEIHYVNAFSHNVEKFDGVLPKSDWKNEKKKK